MRRILTVRGMQRMGRIQRMRGDTKDGEDIQGRILRMGKDTEDTEDEKNTDGVGDAEDWEDTEDEGGY
jgi:hypothetical protein